MKYVLRADGCDTDLTADNVTDARKEALERLRDGWGVAETTETWWAKGILVEVDDDGEGDSWSLRVALDPPVPACDASLSQAVRDALGDEDCEERHRWREPHRLVGGCESNPGVHGHGGGVTAESVCTLCGCKRVIDTWAQDMTDGTQGLTSVRYEEGAYAQDIRRRLHVAIDWTADEATQGHDDRVTALIDSHGASVEEHKEHDEDGEGVSLETWEVEVSSGARKALVEALQELGAVAVEEVSA